jgi:uncharacterized protein (TIGR02646 family)
MAKAIALRPTFRRPAARLAKTVQFSAAHVVFLNSIKPWQKKHWDKSFGTPAQNATRNAIKEEIKTQLVTIQNNYCAFCGIDLDIVPNMHREHIAPQYKHPTYIFEPENLVLACYYCNMHKNKKKTVITQTNIYKTELFKILHPHRDDFSAHLDCDTDNNDLVFTILDPAGGKTQETIDCVGLAEPHLVTQRGAVILKKELSRIPPLNFLVNQTIKERRKRD